MDCHVDTGFPPVPPPMRAVGAHAGLGRPGGHGPPSCRRVHVVAHREASEEGGCESLRGAWSGEASRSLEGGDPREPRGAFGGCPGLKQLWDGISRWVEAHTNAGDGDGQRTPYRKRREYRKTVWYLHASHAFARSAISPHCFSPHAAWTPYCIVRVLHGALPNVPLLCPRAPLPRCCHRPSPTNPAAMRRPPRPVPKHPQEPW